MCKNVGALKVLVLYVYIDDAMVVKMKHDTFASRINS